MTTRLIKPAQAGLVVRRPENRKPLAVDGEPVEWTPYWQRRLDDGSVIEAAQMPAEKPKPPTPEGDKGTKAEVTK